MPERAYRVFTLREWRGDHGWGSIEKYVLQGTTGRAWHSPSMRALCGTNKAKPKAADFEKARNHILSGECPTASFHPCGIYLVYDPVTAYEYGYSGTATVIASCLYYGAVDEREKGVRAEKVRIEHLFVRPDLQGSHRYDRVIQPSPREIAEKLSVTYKCGVSAMPREWDTYGYGWNEEAFDAVK